MSLNLNFLGENLSSNIKWLWKSLFRHLQTVWDISCKQWAGVKSFLIDFASLYSLAGMIQISNTTNMLLDMQGGFKTEERGGVEVKVSFIIITRKYGRLCRPILSPFGYWLEGTGAI